MVQGRIDAVLQQLGELVDGRAAGDLADGQLLAAFAERNAQPAFTELVRRYGPMVLGLSRRVVCDHHAAKDVFQAVFLVLARKAGTLNRKPSLANWLYTVAYHLALRSRTRLARRRSQERQVSDMPSLETNTDAAWGELRGVLDEEVSRLPAKYREPIVLCYFQGMTNEKAAIAIGCPKGTVLSRLNRARERLRVRLLHRGVTLAPAAVAALVSAHASAAVPAPLTQTTTQAATAFAAGQAVAHLASHEAILLARGALQSMVLRTLRLVAGATVLVCLLGFGVAVYGLGRGGDTPPLPSPPKPAPPLVVQAPPRPPVQPLRDLHGDLLPEAAVARLGTLHFRHGNHAERVAFSPNGQYLATGDTSAVVVWEVATGKRLAKLPAGGPKTDFAFAPDNRRMVTAALGHCEVWDFVDTKQLVVLTPAADRFTDKDAIVGGVAFSPDGKSFVCSHRGPTLRVYDANTGKEERRFSPRNLATTVAFAPDGKTLATAGYGKELEIFDVATGKVVHTLSLPAQAAQIAYAPDGKTIASACDAKVVHVWDTTTGKEVRKLEGHEDNVYSVSFSPDGKFLATGSLLDRTGRIWDLNTGKEVCKLQGPGYLFASVAYATDGRKIASAGEGAVCLWDVETGKEIFQKQGHTAAVRGLAFSPDGKTLASASLDGSVRVWQADTSKELLCIQNHREPVLCVAVSPDGKTLASSGWDPVIQLHDLGTGKAVGKLTGHKAYVQGLAWAPDGATLASASLDGSIRVWNPKTGKEVLTIAEDKTRFYSLAFAPDGGTLAASTGANVSTWDAKSGKLLHRTKEPSQMVSFSPDGKLMAGGNIELVKIWDAASGRETRSWERRMELQVGIPEPRARWVIGSAFSPDGKLLAVGFGDGTVCLWETVTGQQLPSLRGHEGLVWKVAFSPDGRSLASGADDSTLLVWDVTGRSLTGNLQPAAPTDAELNALWSDLGINDPAKGQKAVWTLVAAPKNALSFLREHLKPVPVAEAARLTQLIADLDSNQQATRDQATAELERLVEGALPTLEKLLDGDPSVEAQRRARRLWQRVGTVDKPGPEIVRAVRAVQVLEYLDLAESRDLLNSLAAGNSEARLTQESIASLKRVRHRSK